MQLNRRWAASAGCLLAALAIPAPVWAASSGVHVDPNSPPGKEYAIPLQSARTQSSGGSASAPARPSTQPTQSAAPTSTQPAANSGLFGAGISRPSHPRAKKAAATPATVAPTPLPVVSAADRRRVSGGGGSTAMFWVLAALALLIPGLAVGLGVRRWRQA